MVDSLDINALISKGNVVVTSGEHDEERRARLVREEREHRSDLFKSWILFALLILSYVGLFGLCVYVLISSDLSMETMPGKLAWLGVSTLFSGLVSGFAGMMIGLKRR